MNREILFRGKRLEIGQFATEKVGKWVYGGYAKDCSGEYIYNTMSAHRMVKVDPSTVSQHTGLTDKNGVKIFEGDILQTKYGRLCSVRWFESNSVLCFDQKPINIAENILKKAPDEWDLWNEENIEVVGNIHDNPELLGGNDGQTP